MAHLRMLRVTYFQKIKINWFIKTEVLVVYQHISIKTNAKIIKLLIHYDYIMNISVTYVQLFTVMEPPNNHFMQCGTTYNISHDIFVNLLLVSTNSFILFTPKELKKSRDFICLSSALLLYVQVPYMLLTLKR
jgi:hypothetical protein